MELLFVLWGLCGLFAGMIASSRGASFVGWFIIGVIFGPLGVLAAVFAPRSDAATTPPPPGAPAADWYPDPVAAHELRYWDGRRWTDQVADAGVQSRHRLPAS